MTQRIAVIIGAGPAGLTTAYELLDKTDIKPVVYEMSESVGGISKTINYKGNRIDIGAHRFFSKSKRVMQWWQNILPVQGAPSKDDIAIGRKVPLSEKSVKQVLKTGEIVESEAPDPEKTDKVMLARSRLSRIFFLRNLFDYPLVLSASMFLNLGVKRTTRIILSYARTRISPIKEEKSLEDFFINRFGRELYTTFFKDYTEKMWGIPCDKISPDWGAQRVKGLSLTKTISHGIKQMLSKDRPISQKNNETSLIDKFLYPKLGAGQIWEEVARIIKENGGEVHLNHRVVGIKSKANRIVGVEVRNETTGELATIGGDYLFSTMPAKELIQAFDGGAPPRVKEIAGGLMHRNFITVGLLIKEMRIKNDTKVKTINNIIPDNWIYIQDKNVSLGRIDVINNWSPYLVKDKNMVCLGLEYFCSEGDDLWNMKEGELTGFAVDEIAKIGIIEKEDVLDSVAIRMPNAYPVYAGTYGQFGVVREFTDKFENLFLIGRSGMHRYNNQDHSMLTAIAAVENIINNISSKDNIWAVNAEEDYHETSGG